MALSSRDPGYCPAPSYANAPPGRFELTAVDPVRYLPTRSDCRHDLSAPCEVHGCPFCQDAHEQLPWVDPCQTCVQLRDQAYEAFVALNPALACERADHLRCETCGRCGVCAGQVCRTCRQCAEHTEDDYGACFAGAVWNRARRREVPFYKHSFYDLATGRWGR